MKVELKADLFTVLLLVALIVWLLSLGCATPKQQDHLVTSREVCTNRVEVFQSCRNESTFMLTYHCDACDGLQAKGHFKGWSTTVQTNYTLSLNGEPIHTFSTQPHQIKFEPQ